ncbi:glycosyltransferase family 2 protein [Nocardioides pocheonensis]|uniref:Glycosyltransferase family 2 protein n=2 Tax=Nocardioides pocheonensis TaxID=661485 RepID=A0A3N0GQA2_9ACTN|nr:glycosyltransferase family 2 protein [Nocardioides pocheonensis]
MPCLNESVTLATCIRHARAFLDRSGVSGEIVVADNGSTDGSQDIARAEGARVVVVEERGYGAALAGGIAASRGTYVAMGDADDSYDFEALGPFLDELRSGADLVMGNRFRGGIDPGAMPPLHRYVGNPILSFVGRLFFEAPVRDFHCGLRAFRRDSISALDLRTSGMEFASEMVVKACLAELDVREVPARLRRDGRERRPHLRSFRDGWRHLRFLLLYSPRWLFLYPGVFLALLGLVMTSALIRGPIVVGGHGLDVGAMLYGVAATVVGYQAAIFAVLSKVYAAHEGFLPAGARFHRFQERLNLEKLIGIGFVIFLVGVGWTVASLIDWRGQGFGALKARDSVRAAAPAMLGLILGSQTVMAGLFLSLLRIRVIHPEPVAVVTKV